MSNTNVAPQVAQRPRDTTELQRYSKVLIFGLVVFGLLYWYTVAQDIPSPVNKAVADTSVILMGASMLLSSICYFWNFLDFKIIYRKYLGMVGFAFGILHIVLSFSALQRLFLLETWQQNAYAPALAGLLAAIIFGVMAVISNTFAMSVLGGKLWRYILRTGYLAMILVLAHVVLLKLARWTTWYNQGMQSPPSASLLISVFIVIVVVMRVLLWWSIKRKRT